MFIWIVISFKILFARNSDLIMPLGTKIANACEGYKVVKKLGVGAFSRVFQVQGMYGEVAAIKCIKQSVISRVGTESIVREIKILRMLHHQHILELYDFAWDDKYIYLITEYCELGDLSRHIIKNKGVPRHLIHRFLQQLAHGLRFLRKHNVSHFDLKPSNLLVTRCPRLCLKIADFGFAQMMSDEERSNKIKGSPAYMAPEMILCQEYSAKADLWSVGIILYECLFGQLPLPNTACELVAHIEKNVPMPIPENARLSPACYNLLTWLLQYDPDSRIDFDSFFSHEFIDLEHYPCDKNYEKGVRFVYKAIEYDQNRQYHQAFEFYCEALRFMIPYLHEMEDPIQKRQLQQKVLEYTTRAEELKSIYFILNRETLKEPKTDPLEAVNEETRAMLSLYEPRSKGRMSLECGFIGQMFVVDGKYKLAIRKLRQALNTLIHYALRETISSRKELLDYQVKCWAALLRNVQTLYQAQITTVGSLTSGGVDENNNSVRKSYPTANWSMRYSSRKQTAYPRRMAIINSFDQRMKMLAFLPIDLQETLIKSEEDKIWKRLSEGRPDTKCAYRPNEVQERCSIM